jgi:hypothetical protein
MLLACSPDPLINPFYSTSQKILIFHSKEWFKNRLNSCGSVTQRSLMETHFFCVTIKNLVTLSLLSVQVCRAACQCAGSVFLYLGR